MITSGSDKRGGKPEHLSLFLLTISLKIESTQQNTLMIKSSMGMASSLMQLFSGKFNLHQRVMPAQYLQVVSLLEVAHRVLDEKLS